MAFSRSLAAAVLAAATLASGPSAADGPQLLVDAGTGEVLAESHAGNSWHPASLAKLMTALLALDAVEDGRLSMESPVTFSAHAAAQAPSKLGIPPGRTVTLREALEAMLVKSANDAAVAVGEAVAGSEEAFAALMNDRARDLGMTATVFANANGLPDPRQVTTARDLAVLALAILKAHPKHAPLFGMRGTVVAGKSLRSTNGMLGRVPGIDGMKTGYICASGFNIAATAERNGRRLLAVVLGSPSPAKREATVRILLEIGFRMKPGSGARLASFAISSPSPATDLRPHACGRKWKGFPAVRPIGDAQPDGQPRF